MMKVEIGTQFINAGEKWVYVTLIVNGYIFAGTMKLIDAEKLKSQNQ